MKKILITGAGSYIGTSFEKYIQDNYADEYVVDTVDMIDGTWREADFSGYDAVFHVAGIAHQKETEENAGLYYKVNCDLVIETAKKAKKDGVEQFVFLSSMSVYGMDVGVITKDTIPNPKSHYGKSKWKAETAISQLQDETFKVCILRPPMVYGKGCKGNFQSVIKIVKKSPVFPKVENKRSMIYVENLSVFVKLCVDKELRGVYFPQNQEYVNTSEMAAIIADMLDKKCHKSVLAGILLKCAKPFLGIAKKGFGTLIYRDTEDFAYEYCIVDFVSSVKESV